MAFLKTKSKSGRPGNADALLRCLLVVCIFVTGHAVTMQGQTIDEDQVKAAFLFNFAKFITWPATTPNGPPATLEICVAGADSIADALKIATKGKSIDSRQVVIQKVDSAVGLQTCQILYIGDQTRRTLEILAIAAKHPIVTVGEDDRFIRRGGMINFVPSDGRLRFEINVDAASRSGIVISSKLLQVARVVHDQ